MMIANDLELALDVIDRPLRRAQAVRVVLPWKATAEHHAGGFAQDLHVRAEGLANQLEDCGFAGPRASGQYDPSSMVRLAALAGVHRSSKSVLVSCFAASRTIRSVHHLA